MESDGENNQSTPWFISKINDAAVKFAPCTAADSRQRQGADGCVRPSVAYIFIQRNPCDTLTAARIRSGALGGSEIPTYSRCALGWNFRSELSGTGKPASSADSPGDRRVWCVWCGTHRLCVCFFFLNIFCLHALLPRDLAPDTFITWACVRVRKRS